MTTRKQSVSCGMSAADLQAAFDGGAGITAVMQHVTKCRACARTLRALEVQREAVESLMSGAASAGSFGTATRGASATAVQGMLAHSARAGRTKMADLVYELAKACLIALPDLERRVRRIEEPRAVPQVSRDVQALNLRLPAFEKSADVSALPRAKPSEPAALDAARSCLKILEYLEGTSPRQVLATSHWLIFTGKPAKAEACLLELLSRPRLEDVYRKCSRINLMLARARLQDFNGVVAIGKDALSASQSDWQVTYNLAVAYAWLGDKDSFVAVTKQLRKVVALPGSDYLRQLLEFESERFASQLAIPEAEVESLFGLVSTVKG
ncbi:MAG: hypothetical protein ACT4PU_13830 [Planctomycetota bacterium]